MTTAIPSLRFRNDGPMRKRLFVPDAMAHPAKGLIYMWQECIERYSKPGDTILDPMSGIGTTLIAALMGRSVICVELEPHFVDPMRRSWEKMRTMPMLGYVMGTAIIIQGDARNLSGVLADCVITSPPFEQAQSGGGIAIHGHTNDPGLAQRVYSDRAMGTRKPVDAIVTSPPFAGTSGGAGNGPSGRGHQGRYPGIHERHHGSSVGNFPGSTENIGNLRNAAYWTAMQQVYQQCYRVLRPGGILALVLKGFTRDGKYVDLPGQTEALLLEAGWVKHDEWRRELWALSFWRILQQRRDPAAFDDRLKFEEVLAFKKPEDAEGNGVAAVITSPPYDEGLGHGGKSNEVDATKHLYGRMAGNRYTRPS
ncbi:MAG: DNA methyltransferase, partial [Chloroflexota bacterium]